MAQCKKYVESINKTSSHIGQNYTDIIYPDTTHTTKATKAISTATQLKTIYGNVDTLTKRSKAIYGNVDTLQKQSKAIYGNVAIVTTLSKSVSSNLDSLTSQAKAIYGNVASVKTKTDSIVVDESKGSTSIGYNNTITASNQIKLGTSSQNVYIPGTLTVDSALITKVSVITGSITLTAPFSTLYIINISSSLATPVITFPTPSSSVILRFRRGFGTNNVITYSYPGGIVLHYSSLTTTSISNENDFTEIAYYSPYWYMLQMY